MLAIAAVVLAAATRVTLAWTDVATLAVKVLPDDAFYYFRIAQHLVRGDGVTFDGLTPTNGFHPLWLFAISPFFSLSAADNQLPIHLSLTLSTLLNIATVPFIYAIVTHLSGNRRAAACSVVLYASNPCVAMESLNGLETALGNLLYAALVWYSVTRCEGLPRGRMWRLGLLAGVTILARTDNVFLFAAILLAALSDAEHRVRPARLVAPVLVAAAVLLPWLVWSAWVTGSLVQTSGLAVPFVLRGNILPELGTASLGQWMAAQTLDGFRLALRYAGPTWPPLPFVVAAAAVASSFFTNHSGLRRRLAQLNYLVVALLAQVLFHSTYRLYPRSWYFVPVGLLAASYLGLVFDYLGVVLKSETRAAAAAITVTLVLAGLGAQQFQSMWRTGWYPWQAEMLAAGEWVAHHTRTTDRIGSFNAGIIAYWNPDRRVINLDGVVNGRAFAALQQRQLWPYIQAVQIRYLVDYDAFFFAAPADFSGSYARYFGASVAEHTEQVEKISGTLAGSDLVVLRVK